MNTMGHTEGCGRDSGCLGCTQDAALLIAAAVERERERIACAIEARRLLPYVIPSLVIVRNDALTVAAEIARAS